MSQGGKAGVNPQAAARSGSRTASRGATSRSAPAQSTARTPAVASSSRPRQTAAPAPAAARSPDSGTNPGPSRGRQASLARRQAMTRNGKAGLGMVRGGSGKASTLEALAASMDVDCSEMSGREICRLRRQALSQGGKQALNVQPSPVRRAPSEQRPEAPVDNVPRASETGEMKKEGCGCGCKGKKREEAQPTVEEAAVEAGLDAVCEAAESADDAESPGPMMSSVRALCMARRQALAGRGKKALRQPLTGGGLSQGTLPRQRSWKGAQKQGLSGREIARQRREELCAIGRGTDEKGRPCGRMRPQTGPVKVEEGTTLAGQRVSGTQVDRSARVTGIESGSCRTITGTEYTGAEQYERFCRTRPEANAPKVSVTHTLRGQGVTGTEVGRSVRVTGDEYGSCKPVTGTEYIGAEQYAEFCATGPQPGPRKTSAMPTRGGESVSGTAVGRSVRVTGDEAGSGRPITGTDYVSEAASEVPGMGKSESGPLKVGVMHTLRGRELTGTEVGRSVKVTGDEPGSCKSVTGTEYIGAEQYVSGCGTRPAPGPEKVSRLSTPQGLAVTGTAVGRSERVTGDEPGSCARLTGTPYYNQDDFAAACEAPAAGGVPKVGVMHTLKGREVSGTVVGGSFRVTGDEYGGCKPITGTEYVGSEHYDAFCASRPDPSPEKVTVGRTWNQQAVSGSAVGRSARVTGDEYGACKPVTGTAYIGPDQYQDFCEAPDTGAAQERVAQRHSTPGMPVTGSQPGYDPQVTGTERGACQPVSGAPYVGADDFAQTCHMGGAADLHPRLRPEGQPAQAAPQGFEPAPNSRFSVVSPAREAWERRDRRVTGTAYGANGTVTGPINKAAGLISGTPEFRYSEGAAAPGQAVPAQPEAPPAASRITGNGSESGVTITGDHWARGSSVTGTEGFSVRRNATQRGEPRGEGRSAVTYRGMERPEVPESRITGSSGNTSKGSLVTLSGGARG
ncbi:carboxysome shell protein [Thioalkalivibrio denitrificans]|uniref:Carboxysome shell protein n=1 Tax=Thioalkalivibrio denitrificans TaxID=108003 RepID=A0A1V3NJ91_9GAMM|nr:CsoS2 family carboxysome shell protein [Thioalkalivibrio denitrificans]OOG24958.1 carboxysome shell protein [Thioalkalivibrio denitrificans]